jgi:hypothetical protein
MTTTTTAKGPIATATPILALDLGKYKSVACGYDPATAGARFQTLETTATTTPFTCQGGRKAVSRQEVGTPPQRGAAPCASVRGTRGLSSTARP